jgi:putative ABC transport system substrate-binding protein
MVMRLIGFLDSASPDSRGEELDAFHRGLREAGIGGKDVGIVYCWADNDYDRLPGLAQQLLDMKVDVIVAPGGPASALAAQAATREQEEGKRTPVVFTTVTDPVGSGLVESLSNPGGNLTGTFGYTSELEPSRLKVLDALVKKKGAFGILINPKRPHPKDQLPRLEAETKNVLRQLVVRDADSDGRIDMAFSEFGSKAKSGEIVALLVTADPYFNSRRDKVIALAEELSLPAIYQWPGFVEAGGLMSFGPSKAKGYHNAGEYAGRILNGENPMDLPVRETKDFELVINAAAAERYGIEIPDTILDCPVRVLRS